MRRQAGFSLVSAIFLLVVLAALGGYMVTISGTQHYTSMNSLQAVRAYQAARSGVEWAVAQTVANVTAGGGCAGPVPVNGTNPVFPGHAAFTMAITCTSTAHVEGTNNYSVFYVTATATTTGMVLGTPGFASRRVGVTFTR